MVKYHLKRLATPRQWRILRKANKYITRPNPGAHSFELCMSLNTILIQLGKAQNKKEVKYLLQRGEVFVNGKKIHEEKLPVGFMDILSFPKTKENFRVTITNKGLEIKPIKEPESKTKLVKITGKSNIAKGKTQLHTLDGRNINIDNDLYKVGDSLIIELPSQKIKDHLKLENNCTLFLYKGAHTGTIGKAEKVEGRKIFFSSGKEKYETRRGYAFVIGKEKPVITI